MSVEIVIATVFSVFGKVENTIPSRPADNFAIAFTIVHIVFKYPKLILILYK